MYVQYEDLHSRLEHDVDFPSRVYEPDHPLMESAGWGEQSDVEDYAVGCGSVEELDYGDFQMPVYRSLGSVDPNAGSQTYELDIDLNESPPVYRSLGLGDPGYMSGEHMAAEAEWLATNPPLLRRQNAFEFRQ